MTALSSLEGPKTLTDFRTLKAEFERIGLPARTANLLVALLVRYDFEQQLHQLTGRPDPAAYWLNPSLAEHSDNTAEIRRRLDAHAGKLMRDLGLEAFWDSVQAESHQRRLFVELQPEKFIKLRQIMSDYEALRNLADNPTQADLIRQEMRTDLERLLTPEELRHVEYRMSNAADILRAKLGQFHPTQPEFDALFPQVKALLGKDWLINATELSPAKQKQFDDALRQALGDARYRELTETNSDALRHAQQFVVDFDLPPRLVPELRSVRRDFEPRLGEIRDNQGLTPQQRVQQIDALIAEVDLRLRGFLNDAQIKNYRGTAGHWLYSQRTNTDRPSTETP